VQGQMAAHAAFYLKANCSSYCISFLVFLFECQQSSVAMVFASCAAAVVIAAVPVISNSTRSFDLLTKSRLRGLSWFMPKRKILF